MILVSRPLITPDDSIFDAFCSRLSSSFNGLILYFLIPLPGALTAVEKWLKFLPYVLKIGQLVAALLRHANFWTQLAGNFKHFSKADLY
ncbi:MAG: hypothetical protein MI674_02810, partial [Cytophagales bacterium]|nr:hypothetical protein [Cytophagales bacterium]